MKPISSVKPYCFYQYHKKHCLSPKNNNKIIKKAKRFMKIKKPLVVLKSNILGV